MLPMTELTKTYEGSCDVTREACLWEVRTAVFPFCTGTFVSLSDNSESDNIALTL